ncbi:MAG: hypothetical protein AAGE98_21215 [Actinomycetota bacterium]
MSQPVPNIDPDDVTRLLTRDFGDSADAARGILGALSGTHPGAVARVSAAAIKLSGGDLEQLRSAVAMGLADWRDVLSAAEYPRYMRLGDDPRPDERAAAIEADGAEYRAWLAD